jgi:thiol-disulfide isomerase/thioredoxin
MKYVLLICGCLFLGALHAQQPAADALKTIKVRTIEGKAFSLSGIHKRLTALVFLSPDCPLSRNYTIVLNELQKNKKDSLAIVGVFAGTAYSDDEIKAFQQKYAVDFVLVRDKKEALVNYTQATVTPEVFLYDSNSVLVYEGAIDDWAVSLGKKKREASKHYLRDAINNFLQYRTVNPFKTAAVGCLISNK